MNRPVTNSGGPPVIVVLGPTAVGKTAVVIELALALDTAVVCADSMLVYRGMDIGTAKPTPAERRGVPHYGLDLAEPTESFSVARYLGAAGPHIAALRHAGRKPIVSGGTGLYLRALTEGLVRAPALATSLAAELETLAKERGPARLHAELSRVDPASAGRIGPTDTKRLVRALGVVRQYGIPLSRLQRETTRPPPFPVLRLGLMRPRETLYRRIEQRVDHMIRRGLAHEARRILGNRPSRTARAALGYKEFEGYFRGTEGIEAAVDRIKTRTRRFCKRQLTWFRRDTRVHWIDLDDDEAPRTTARRLRRLLGTSTSATACNCGADTIS